MVGSSIGRVGHYFADGRNNAGRTKRILRRGSEGLLYEKLGRSMSRSGGRRGFTDGNSHCVKKKGQKKVGPSFQRIRSTRR